jgi:hypothetical protein
LGCHRVLQQLHVVVTNKGPEAHQLCFCLEHRVQHLQVLTGPANSKDTQKSRGQ